MTQRELFKVKSIVLKNGGYREKEILNNPYTVERSETWNDEHKVLNVYSTPDETGHCDGFSVDISQGKICG